MWLTAAKGKGVEVLGIIVRIINLISSAALVVTIAMKSVVLLISRGKQEVVFSWTGTFSRRQGQIYMDMTFHNKAMQAMGDFAIQFNKNRWVAIIFS